MRNPFQFQINNDVDGFESIEMDMLISQSERLHDLLPAGVRDTVFQFLDKKSLRNANQSCRWFYHATKKEFDKRHTFQTWLDSNPISCGLYHTAFSKPDGSVWISGSYKYTQPNSYDDTADSFSLRQMQGISGVAQVSVGSCFLMRKFDGTVWSYGRNNCGQLGIGNRIDQMTPQQIKKLSNVKFVIATGVSSYFLLNDGTVWMSGNTGEEDVGGSIYYLEPQKIPGIFDVAQIVAHEQSIFFIKKDGTVWAYGDNSLRYLGLDNQDCSSHPMQIKNLSHVAAVKVDNTRSYFKLDNEKVFACGFNNQGQLGVGDQEDRLVPHEIKKLRNVHELAVDFYGVTFIKNDGTLWRYGGDADEVPRQIKLTGKFIKIVSNGRNSFALTTEGKIFGWGENMNGELGLDHKNPQKTPTELSFRLFTEKDFAFDVQADVFSRPTNKI